jgi:hypothetical protein
MQANKKRKPEKKLFTVEEANATLPLLRSILRDVTELAREVRDRHERLGRIRQDDRKGLSKAHDEELEGIQAELERARKRMEGYEQELRGLGVELKDYYTGLVDFPCRMDGREVYLCWRLGEPEVAHWHELDAGFAGRQRLLTTDASKR